MPRKSPLDRLFDELTDRVSDMVDDFLDDAEGAVRNTLKQAGQTPLPRRMRTGNARKIPRAQTNRTARQTYYSTLGVDPSAPQEVIQAAYKALARRHHPDAGGSEQAMRMINQAYEVLSDPEKRREYDRILRRDE